MARRREITAGNSYYVSTGNDYANLCSEEGGKDHAVVLCILSTCRRHGLEPWAYLTDVIRQLTEGSTPNLEELLPYNWKQKYPTRQLSEIIVAKDAPKVLEFHTTFEKPRHPGILKNVS